MSSCFTRSAILSLSSFFSGGGVGVFPISWYSERTTGCASLEPGELLEVNECVRGLGLLLLLLLAPLLLLLLRLSRACCFRSSNCRCCSSKLSRESCYSIKCDNVSLTS